MNAHHQSWLNISDEAREALQKLLLKKENAGKVARIFVEGFG
jgi:Fe-S cluster assembly iron-binding protein IscA